MRRSKFFIVEEVKTKPLVDVTSSPLERSDTVQSTESKYSADEFLSVKVDFRSNNARVKFSEEYLELM